MARGNAAVQVDNLRDEYGRGGTPFKVGDRVRTKGYEGTCWDGEGVVTEDYDGCCLIVRINEREGGFAPHELALVATTKPPRLGRRYRTADGHITGMMQHGLEAMVDGHMRVYDKAGGHVFGRPVLDLVEELPPAPSAQARSNAAAQVDNLRDEYESVVLAATAGHTVPLCAYDEDPGWYAAELGRAYADGYSAGLRAAA